MQEDLTTTQIKISDFTVNKTQYKYISCITAVVGCNITKTSICIHGYKNNYLVTLESSVLSDTFISCISFCLYVPSVGCASYFKSIALTQ